MPDRSPRVAGVVLAAGAGRRFGMPKALVPYQGSLLVERAARVLASAGCDPVVVVLGARADEVRERADLGSALVAFNPDWPTGMGSSLRTALTLLAEGTSPDDVIATVVLPVDMPGVTADAAARVADHATPEALAAATYGEQRGHPVLLGRDHWNGVRASASGDAGARHYLRRHDVTPVPCEDVANGRDVDHPADLR